MPRRQSGDAERTDRPGSPRPHLVGWKAEVARPEGHLLEDGLVKSGELGGRRIEEHRRRRRQRDVALEAATDHPRREPARHQACRRLTALVGTGEADHLARLNLEREIRKSRATAARIPVADRLELDHRSQKR